VVRIFLSGILLCLSVLALGCGSAAVETTGGSVSVTSAAANAESGDASTDTDSNVAPGSTEAVPSDSTTTIAESAVDTTSEPSAGEQVGLVGGGQLDLGSIEGMDTVLWFWAPW
jgi:hypothetical protein